MSSREDVNTIVIGGSQTGSATGYFLYQQEANYVILSPDYPWINLPVFDHHGNPRHPRGVVPDMPGLYFVGLHFQTTLTSVLLDGVVDDAQYICKQIRRNHIDDHG